MERGNFSRTKKKKKKLRWKYIRACKWPWEKKKACRVYLKRLKET